MNDASRGDATGVLVGAVRERPIPYTAPMIRKVRADEKLQTRRLVGLDSLRPSETPGYDWTWRGRAPIRSIAQQRRYPSGCWQDVRHADLLALCPYGVPGDRLWCREAWRTDAEYDRLPPRDIPADAPVFYEADPHVGMQMLANACDVGRCRHARFMCRWMSRITLEITDVRVERLHDISEEDAIAEGVKASDAALVFQAGAGELGCSINEELSNTARGAFACLWDSINARRAPFASNPWVWVLTFRRLP